MTGAPECGTKTSGDKGNTMTQIDTSAINQHEPGVKLDHGKTKAGLLEGFARALLAVAEVGTYGAEKYSVDGWKHVKDGERRYSDAAWRHRLARASGEEVDNESGLPHSAHEAWNVLACLELQLKNNKTKKNEDHRPVLCHP